MALTLNLRQLEKEEHICFQGKLSPEELEMQGFDDLIELALPVKYDLEAELIQDSILIRGSLEVVLECECVRCLKTFEHPVPMDEWVCHMALKGEEAEPVLNDLVDLTPHIREDIFLALPQHPVCNPECQGLTSDATSHVGPPDRGDIPDEGASAWAALDKLKLD